jgi:hypothetical protein
MTVAAQATFEIPYYPDRFEEQQRPILWKLFIMSVVVGAGSALGIFTPFGPWQIGNWVIWSAEASEMLWWVLAAYIGYAAVRTTTYLRSDHSRQHRIVLTHEGLIMPDGRRWSCAEVLIPYETISSVSVRRRHVRIKHASGTHYILLSDNLPSPEALEEVVQTLIALVEQAKTFE